MLPMTDAPSRRIRHLFDAELRYQEGMTPVFEGDDPGHLVGSGTGCVTGPGISGRLRWSNFEQVFADYCRLNVVGTIETDDGAEIRFDSQGFALPPMGTRAGAWKVASAVRFLTRATAGSRRRRRSGKANSMQPQQPRSTVRISPRRATMRSRRQQWSQASATLDSACASAA